MNTTNSTARRRQCFNCGAEAELIADATKLAIWLERRESITYAKTLRALISLASPSPTQTEWRQWLARQLLDDRLSDHEAANVVAFHPSITDEWRKSPSPTQTEALDVNTAVATRWTDEAGGERISYTSPAQWSEDVVERAAKAFFNRAPLASFPCWDDLSESHKEEWRRDMRAALATLPPPEDAWRPIETAPKDGTIIDVWAFWPEHGDVSRVPDAYFTNDDWKLGQYYARQFLQPPQVTHWRPSPAPPGQVSRAAQAQPGVEYLRATPELLALIEAAKVYINTGPGDWWNRVDRLVRAAVAFAKSQDHKA